MYMFRIIDCIIVYRRLVFCTQCCVKLFVMVELNTHPLLQGDETDAVQFLMNEFGVTRKEAIALMGKRGQLLIQIYISLWCSS